ncbi:hypothetical protein [Limimaricola cinnabarinus]|uniref:hypothetical protein n=1 Tax=Limimaricola cinnabarinus TaxID=1125964 RepID=UPI002491D96A|nr:hypothetical protein [Limimaricola cinnabarinus]
MKTIHLSEFKNHLETAHLRTRFEYFEPREHVPNVAWGAITNEIISNGSSFSKMALFYHMMGDTSRHEIHPFLDDKALSQETAFHLLTEDGDDASRHDIETAVLEVRPDILSFDASILGSEDLGVIYVVDRDAPRTYCIQRDHQPDLVFEGVINSWDYDVHTWSDWTRWVSRIEYVSLRNTIIASREITMFCGRNPVKNEREVGEFRTQDEADTFLYGRKSITIAQRAKKEKTPAPSVFCPFRGTHVAPSKKVYSRIRH